MTRRTTKNVTGIARIEGVLYHDAWVAFVCVKCKHLNTIRAGKKLLNSTKTFEDASWQCGKCKFKHSSSTSLPFPNWPKAFRKSTSVKAQRFWEAFFRISTEHPESYWKQCNVCGRILPFSAFSKHAGWGPLERQMECRSCKGAINAELNPKRTKQQLFESSIRRRVADLFVEEDNETIDIEDLFKRFKGRCFKTKKKLDMEKRSTWAIDHILPSRWLYPLCKENAALLSRNANDNKRDKWPSQFYTNSELIELAKVTGADLSLISSKTPSVNRDININAGVRKFLTVREKSNLSKRIKELKKILKAYDLSDGLDAAGRSQPK